MLAFGLFRFGGAKMIIIFQASKYFVQKVPFCFVYFSFEHNKPNLNVLLRAFSCSFEEIYLSLQHQIRANNKYLNMAKEEMIDRDPFSNGSEYSFWEERNCEICHRGACAIKNDIFTRMCCNKPIRKSSYDACQYAKCPNFIDHIERKSPRKREIKEQYELNFE